MNNSFKESLTHYLDESMDPKEIIGFIRQMNLPENRSQLEESISESLESETFKSLANEKRKEFIFQQIIQKTQKSNKVKIFSMSWFRVAAASAVLILLASAGYFLFNKKSGNARKMASQDQRFRNDIKAPQTNKATLTLADGRVIVIDNINNGEIQSDKNVAIDKQGEQLVYKNAGGQTQDIKPSYNTLSVPRGSRPMQLKLADGTMVWLDAATTITYPTLFINNERKVIVSGQAYFEVTHDASKPFKVDIAGRGEVEVLGTHFNVNAFDDEQEIKVTLITGSVKVSKQSAVGSGQSATIIPGQQASLAGSGDWQVASGVDINQVMAWKNGSFIFNGSDIKTVMRQLARWYDLDLVYKTDSKEKFHFESNRNINITTVLKILEETGAVHFVIEGKKITVE